ncbi:MAG: MarR family transcriptional regulator [Chloroflexi bacterium]|nr:MarR family transcriptional regulator [Chloroflexota bacterium]
MSISPKMEEYLETLGRLEESGQPATVSALSNALGVSPPSVSEMLGRLREQGYITHNAREAAVLTPTGANVAGGLIRKHRLWERFLHDVLGLRWDEVHEQACQLEHVTSPALEERLAQAAGEPLTCPHGSPIPPAGGFAQGLGPGEALCSYAPGQEGIITRVGDDPDLLQAFDRLQLEPGVHLRVLEVMPDGAIRVLTHGAEVTLSTAQSHALWLAPCSPIADEAVLPLGDLAAGEIATVSGFRAGKGMISRCLALGFTPGAEVRVLQNQRGGAMIVLVRDTRVALGCREAQRILVRAKASR